MDWRQPFLSIGAKYYEDKAGVDIGSCYIFRFMLDEKAVNTVKIIPDACIDILVTSDSDGVEAKIYGLVEKQQIIKVNPNKEYFGIRLNAQYAMQFLNIPLKDLTNEITDLKDINEELYELVSSAYLIDDFSKKADVLQKKIDEIVEKNLPYPYALKLALKKINELSGNIKVKKLAEEVGCSNVYVRKLFERYLAISSKAYMEIIRCQTVIKRIALRPNDRISEIIDDLGYFDDAHFINDLKKYCDLSPKELKNILGLKEKSQNEIKNS